MTRIAIAIGKTGERGGAEVLSLKLAAHLRSAGFACNIVEVPGFRPLQPRILNALAPRGPAALRDVLRIFDMLLSYFATRLTRLDAYDLLVVMHPTCLYLRHPKTVIYFLHHDRAAYDLQEFLQDGLSGFYLWGFVFAMWLRRILDLGTIAYVRNKKVRVIAISNNVARRLHQYWRIAANRVVYPGGYEPSFYCLPAAYVLYLGRLDWRVKRLWIVYEAAKHLSDFKFVVAGSGTLPPEKTPPNVELILTKGLFTEREKAELYSRAICVVFPAYDEDFGLVPVEAMSAGKPCIVCADGGAATETIVNGKTGLVVKPTIQSVVWGIRELAKTGQDMKADCIERAKRFSWQTFLTEMENEIQKLLLD